jgi:hypothetical protein
MAAIAKAAAEKPDVILCPGWTFVGRLPCLKRLRKVAGRATVIFEILLQRKVTVRAPANRKSAAKSVVVKGAVDEGVTWNTYVLEQGRVRALPRQVLASSADIDEETGDKLADALRCGRGIVRGIVLICGEVNVVRRCRKQGGIGHIWDPRVPKKTVHAALKDEVVFNPAHTPNSNYVRIKRRYGPWRALVSTSNRLDRRRLRKRGNLPTPAHAVVNRRDCGQYKVEELSDGESRVVFYEVPDWPGADSK